MGVSPRRQKPIRRGVRLDLVPAGPMRVYLSDFVECRAVGSACAPMEETGRDWDSTKCTTPLGTLFDTAPPLRVPGTGTPPGLW